MQRPARATVPASASAAGEDRRRRACGRRPRPRSGRRRAAARARRAPARSGSETSQLLTTITRSPRARATASSAGRVVGNGAEAQRGEQRLGERRRARSPASAVAGGQRGAQHLGAAPRSAARLVGVAALLQVRAVVGDLGAQRARRPAPAANSIPKRCDSSRRRAGAGRLERDQRAQRIDQQRADRGRRCMRRRAILPGWQEPRTGGAKQPVQLHWLVLSGVTSRQTQARPGARPSTESMSRRERQRRRRRNRGSPIKRVFALTGVLMVCADRRSARWRSPGWVVNVAQSAPDLSDLKPLQTRVAVAGVRRRRHARSATSGPRTCTPPVPAAQIPQILKDATISIEDRRFYQHGALDYQGILRAAIKDAFNGGTSLQGASTLTMQLVDNVYLPNHAQSPARSQVQDHPGQAGRAAGGRSTARTGSSTSYLNDVPYGTVGGQTAYGVGAAARMFFDKPVEPLTLAQAALLAGLPQAPSQYNPFIDAGAARHRRGEVLQAMVQARLHHPGPGQRRRPRSASGSRHDRVSTWSAGSRTCSTTSSRRWPRTCAPRPPTTAPRWTKGGLKIYTTIDLRKEALARQAILAHEGGPGQPSAGPGVGQSRQRPHPGDRVLLELQPDELRLRHPGPPPAGLLVQGVRADDADPRLPRRSGQTYYTSKFLPAGWLSSDPTWSVHTAELSYQGNISITKATIVSDNTVFAQLAADLGWGKLDSDGACDGHHLAAGRQSRPR